MGRDINILIPIKNNRELILVKTHRYNTLILTEVMD